MVLFIAVGLALVAWPLLSLSYPNLRSFIQIPLSGPSSLELALKRGNVINPPLATFIEETMALENITGLSVAIVSKNGESEFRTWGYRTEEGDEMTSDTLFYIGSLSKAFCVVAMGLLIDDFSGGRNVTPLPSGLAELTWHTRLKDLLPDWKLMDEWASERANLHDILSHVSGMPRHDFSYGPSDTAEDTLKGLEHLNPAFELREQYSYNNIMYMVAAHVITTYAGQSYTSFVEERIFSPLGMASSTFSLVKAEASRKLTQGWTKQGRRLPTWLTEDTPSLTIGPGGVISNAVDMSKWISMWIGEGSYKNRTIIPLSVYQNASYAYTISEDHPPNLDHSIAGYGMGWDRYSYRGHDIVYHSGGLLGYTTVLVFLPSDKLGVSVFANGGDQVKPAHVISDRILDAALKLPMESAVTSPSRLSRTIATHPTPKFRAKLVPVASSRNITSNLNALAGTYANPGYGNLTLCGPSSPSSYCVQVRSDFATVDERDHHPMTGCDRDAGASIDLVAAWPRVWASHVRMRYRMPDREDSEDEDGSSHERPYATDAFDVSFAALFPNGHGKDKTPFEIEVPYATAEFVVEGGHAVGFWMRESEVWGELVEVWFERVPRWGERGSNELSVSGM